MGRKNAGVQGRSLQFVLHRQFPSRACSIKQKRLAQLALQSAAPCGPAARRRSHRRPPTVAPARAPSVDREFQDILFSSPARLNGVHAGEAEAWGFTRSSMHGALSPSVGKCPAQLAGRSIRKHVAFMHAPWTPPTSSPQSLEAPRRCAPCGSASPARRSVVREEREADREREQ